MESVGTANPLLIDGYTGMPVHVEQQYGPERGSVEWLLRMVERHAAAEAGALDLYAQIADESGDPAVAVVMRLILDDEQRHHTLLKLIESSLRDAVNWSHSTDTLPASPPPDKPLPKGLASIVRDLVADERTGARAMRDLAASENGIAGGLHSVLLEMMALDSEKHAHLLKYVQQRLEARTQKS